MSFLYPISKRAFDILASSTALIILSPVFLATSLAIKLDSKGNVFYAQERVGKDNKHFKMYKFRSMCMDADKQLEALKDKNEREGATFKIKDDPRITKVGKFIRKYSIDELPQLINILKGDMSIVGPRPALPQEVATYPEEAKIRLTVPQGLTCIWQIYERDNPKFSVQVKLDKEYVEKKGFWFDLKLIFLTVPSVLSGKSAY